jgi:hypothetical protein
VNVEKCGTRADFILKTPVPKYEISLFKFSALVRKRTQSLKFFRIHKMRTVASGQITEEKAAPIMLIYGQILN